MKKVALILIFYFVVVRVEAGGGWLQAKGSAYYKLGQNWIVSSAFYAPNGEVIDIRTTALYTSSFYGEYGLSKSITGILYTPFFVRASLNEIRYNQSGLVDKGEELNSIGDTDVGFKIGLIQNKPIVLSATLLFGLPLGETMGGRSGILQSGDGEFNQQLRLDVSHSFYPKPFYASAYVGFNNRTENFSDEVRYGLEAGYTFRDKLIVIGRLNVLQSLFNGERSVAENGIFSNNTEYVSPAIEIAYQLKNSVGLAASAGFATSGKNILASPNFGLGIYWKKNKKN